jgi:hypothetical protein
MILPPTKRSVTLKRRGVIDFGLKTAVGLVAFVPASRALALGGVVASAASAPAPAWEVIQNYVGGRVVSFANEQLELDTYAGRRTVTLTRLTATWKGAWGVLNAIAPGDDVKVWGTPQGSNFVAEKIWVNIVNRVGTYTVVSRSAAAVRVSHLDPRTDRQRDVELGPQTIVIRSGQEGVFDPVVDRVSDAGFMQVIGLERTGAPILATRVWL